jgi:hypothetical protein
LPYRSESRKKIPQKIRDKDEEEPLECLSLSSRLGGKYLPAFSPVILSNQSLLFFLATNTIIAVVFYSQGSFVVVIVTTFPSSSSLGLI